MSVANTGPTIPPEEIQRLFQPFQRLDGQRTHHTIGHGLGLSIVQAIANAHHAELAAQPRDGGGLEVRVSFALSDRSRHHGIEPELDPETASSMPSEPGRTPATGRADVDPGA